MHSSCMHRALPHGCDPQPLPSHHPAPADPCLCSWCACYGRAHFADEAPCPPPTPALATKPPGSPGQDLTGAAGKAAPGKEGEQLIPAWLAGRQGSGTAPSLRDRFTQQSGGSGSASPAGSPRAAAASPTAHRGELLGGGRSAASSPRCGSTAAGGGLAPLVIPTAAEEAARAELFSSPTSGGGSGGSSRATTPVGKGKWASRFK